MLSSSGFWLEMDVSILLIKHEASQQRNNGTEQNKQRNAIEVKPLIAMLAHRLRLVEVILESADDGIGDAFALLSSGVTGSLGPAARVDRRRRCLGPLEEAFRRCS